ncbi:MAG: hypothetical protein HC888_08740 [Candidatus Competibacteraceae bacterium]|nr:hypothetical protein [Candidatus Competibacteraceae bacterium]
MRGRVFRIKDNTPWFGATARVEEDRSWNLLTNAMWDESPHEIDQVSTV